MLKTFHKQKLKIHSLLGQLKPLVDGTCHIVFPIVLFTVVDKKKSDFVCSDFRKYYEPRNESLTTYLY